jgi:hypothetical protein
MATGAELTFTQSTALQMANAIFDRGVQVTGVSLPGPARLVAVYSSGQLSPDAVPSNAGVILPVGRAV